MSTQAPQTTKPHGDPLLDAAAESDRSKANAGGRRADKVDELVVESFPASDPPASWAGADLTPAELEERAAKQAEKQAHKKA